MQGPAYDTGPSEHPKAKRTHTWVCSEKSTNQSSKMKVQESSTTTGAAALDCAVTTATTSLSTHDNYLRIVEASISGTSPRPYPVWMVNCLPGATWTPRVPLSGCEGSVSILNQRVDWVHSAYALPNATARPLDLTRPLSSFRSMLASFLVPG